jgi:molecular chaperone GrpE (heat shock protein)
MVIHLPKWLSVLANILVLVVLMPGIALATPLQIQSNSSVISVQNSQVTSNLIAYSDTDLTPQEHQQLQALRQRRNKEINNILSSAQREKLKEKLRAGNNLPQAIESLDLHPDQQSMIKAVMQLINLKMQAILSRHSLQVGQK